MILSFKIEKSDAKILKNLQNYIFIRETKEDCLLLVFYMHNLLTKFQGHKYYCFLDLKNYSKFIYKN